MKTRLAAFTCALALVASGCTTDNIQTVAMEALCAPPSDAEKCAGTSGRCEMYLASARPWFATQWLGYTNGFEMFTEVHNQAPNNADPSSGRVNTNDVIITGYELDFSSALYNRAAYFYPANFAIPAAGVFSPVIKFIPEEISMEMASILPADATPVAVTVAVRLRGHFLDGKEFTTGTFSIAVDVYNMNAGVPACTGTDLFERACPNGGQTASIACVAPT